MTNTVEVECKFIIPKDLTERLKALNAQLLQDKTFVDTYYDDSRYNLVMADFWLRKRNDVFQMKYPPSNRLESSVSQYVETDDPANIITLICPLLGISSTVEPLSEFINRLVPFASFQTHRRTYKIDDVIIDLDETDFGYCVGEVEVIADNASAVEDAERRIKLLMESLNIEVANVNEGKMQQYLQMNNMELYNRLIAANAL